MPRDERLRSSEVVARSEISPSRMPMLTPPESLLRLR